MSNSTDFDYATAGKPLRVVVYSSGTGTYIPLVDNSRCLVRLQAGGQGGWSYNGGSSPYSGGSAGAFIEVFIRVPIAGLAYIVGAGTAGGSSPPAFGSPTSFGDYVAGPTVKAPGKAGPPGGAQYAAGESFGGPAGGPCGASGISAGGGGSSFWGAGGTGGTTGNGSNGTGAGAGGGGAANGFIGGSGTGGQIIVWEFGA